MRGATVAYIAYADLTLRDLAPQQVSNDADVDAGGEEMNSKYAVRYRWDPAMKASFEPRIRLRGHWDLVRLAAAAPSSPASGAAGPQAAQAAGEGEEAGGGSGIRTPDTRIMIPLL